MAKRMAVGIDQNRLSLLLAVLEKRAGLHLVTDDVFVNIAGGMSIEEPAADLAIVSAVASSVQQPPAAWRRPPSLAKWAWAARFGASPGSLRIREAEQMGFTRIVLPAANVDGDRSQAELDRRADMSARRWTR